MIFFKDKNYFAETEDEKVTNMTDVERIADQLSLLRWKNGHSIHKPKLAKLWEMRAVVKSEFWKTLNECDNIL